MSQKILLVFFHDNKLKVGDTCHHTFASNEYLPKGNENIPKHNIVAEHKTYDISMKELKEEL